jgi:diguanylate cyclase
MTELNNPWRQKYRRGLVEQERLDGTIESQKKMLLRAVLNLSDAACGRDVGLNERLHTIISSIKVNDVTGLDRMLKSLPRVTEEVKKRQQAQWNEITDLMVTIASQAQKQTPSTNLKSTINYFKKQLPKSSPSSMGVAVKKHIDQLIHIQEQAISDASTSKKGLFEQLFKDKSASESPVSLNLQADASDEINTEYQIQAAVPIIIIPLVGVESWVEVDASALIKESVYSGELLAKDPQTVDDVENQRARKATAPAQQKECAQQTPPEVISCLSVVLLELLDHFKIAPAAQQKAIKARKQIAQGLRWFELVPTLEDIRDFVLQAHLDADKDYQQYLEHLYEELSDILSALGVSIETEEQMRAAANALQENVSEGMNNITRALGDNNTDTLKQEVESHTKH